MESQFNPYEVLGLLSGAAADVSDADVKKAYRKLALVKHPDKQQDPELKKKAEEEFTELNKARDILLDPLAKAAIDDVIRAKLHRAEREGQQDAKRRKMREDLERRERQEGTARSELELAQLRLKKELERLREREAQRRQRAQRDQAAALNDTHMRRTPATESPATPSHAPATADQTKQTKMQNRLAEEDAQVLEQLQRTLKVSWNRKAVTYDEAAIRSALSKFGAVDSVLVKQPKKASKKEISAVVVMSTASAALKASDAVVGNPAAPLLVRPLAKVANLAELANNVVGSQQVGAQAGDSRDRAEYVSTSAPATAGDAVPAARQPSTFSGPALFPSAMSMHPSHQQNKAHVSADVDADLDLRSGHDREACDTDAKGHRDPLPHAANACRPVPNSFPNLAPGSGTKLPAEMSPTTTPGLQTSSFPAFKMSSVSSFPSADLTGARKASQQTGASDDIERCAEGWKAAIAAQRVEEARRLSRRAELLARVQEEEGMA